MRILSSLDILFIIDTLSAMTELSKTANNDRQILVDGGKLHWFHWGVISLSLVLTLTAWYFTKKQVEEKRKIQFENSANQVIELVQERMELYENALWSCVSTIHANGGNISYKEWDTYAESLDIDVKYPGINGIGIIENIAPEDMDAYLAKQRKTRPNFKLHPTHDKNEHWPISYSEPVEKNAKAIGLDMAFEENRHSALLKARNTGLAQITGPIVLVQDTGKTPGFLFYTPHFKGGPKKTQAEREESITILVYAPFIMHKLMKGALEKERRSVGISIKDGSDVLYDEHMNSVADFSPDPLFTKEITINMYGRPWTFDIRSTVSFHKSTSNSQPVLILIGGIFIDSLLLFVFVMLTRSNQQAIKYGDNLTDELKDTNEQLLKKSTDLEDQNFQLENFAYITSHDLKTPLRGISHLQGYLVEDLEGYFNQEDANMDVKSNLELMGKQATRMDDLINGILEFSGIGKGKGKGKVEINDIEIEELVKQIASDLEINKHQLSFENLPVIRTNVIQIEQVMTNLISNAKKYHNNKDGFELSISCSDTNKGFYEFCVKDNGPGIETKYQQKIFEPFQKLESKDEIEGTGIGLSIVKKTIESLNGKITVESELGKGTSFIFTWPKTMENEEST
ncbi:MAG: CHASE domain-containing protein [Lentisphaeria bacterium]|nr:CHASE domain-containing protein [Lentisphaeria bacterium]